MLSEIELYKTSLALSTPCYHLHRPEDLCCFTSFDPELRVLVIEDIASKQKIWPYIKAVLRLAYKTCKHLEVKEWFGVPVNENNISATYACFKVGCNKALQPRAVACYEGLLTGRRGTGLGREKAIHSEVYRQEGLEAVTNIVKHDIKNAQQGYWAEISDGVEELYIENNAPVIPNTEVASILQLPETEITKCEDGIHYERIIRMEDKSFKARKMMWGVLDKLKT